MLSPCGKFYLVNGIKKWITNGTFADIFTVAVRTGGKGMKGLSLLIIERGYEGVSTRKMKCQGLVERLWLFLKTSKCRSKIGLEKKGRGSNIL